MEKFSKKTLLNYVNGAGLFGAAPSAGQTVKFQIATGANAIARAAASTTAGALTFAQDSNGNAAIYATDGNGDGILVSSKIQNVVAAAASGAKHGGKTITVTYIGDAGSIQTATFDVIDEAGLEAYFGGKTIALDASTDKFEVKVKENGGIAIDNDGIYAVLDNIFAVDGKTIDFKTDNKTIETKVQIAYVAANPDTEQAAAIQLQDVDGTKLSEVTVASLIGSGIVQSTSYDAATNTLTITWVGGATTTINLSDIFDISDWAVKSDSTDYLSLDISTAAGTAEIGVTSKVKTGIALAESALQGLSEGSSTENYVILTVADGTDPSTKTVAISDAALKTKIDAIDASIDALQEYDTFIDASIDRLDASVSAIEAAIEAMDATESDNVLDGSIAITVTEANGVITGVDLEATKSTVTFDNTPGALNLTGTAGLVTGEAIAQVKAYVDAKSGALDSSVTDTDDGGFVTVKVEQENGALSKDTVTVVYGDYNDPQTDGIATTSATKTYVDTEISDAINALDTSVNDSDASNFVSVKVVEENGLLSSDEVTVQYADVTAAPGAITVNTNGIVKGDVLEAAIEGALTWTVLS